MFYLQKLSPDMPLKLASDTILRMMRARVHHHRQGQVKIHSPYSSMYSTVMNIFFLEGKGWGRSIVCLSCQMCNG